MILPKKHQNSPTVVDDNESLGKYYKENTDKLDSVLSMFKH